MLYIKVIDIYFKACSGLDHRVLIQTIREQTIVLLASYQTLPSVITIDYQMDRYTKIGILIQTLFSICKKSVTQAFFSSLSIAEIEFIWQNIIDIV